LVEDTDFKRVVEVKNPTPRMILVTAISNPKRLEPFLPNGIVEKIYLKDHAYFDEKYLKNRILELNATSLLVTQKDEVKMIDFDLPLSIMELKLDIDYKYIQQIDNLAHIGQD